MITPEKIEEFDKLFEKISYDCERYEVSYSALMYSFDHGSDLKKFKQIVKNNTRPTDTIYEYDKHELLVILENTNIRGALRFFRKIKELENEAGESVEYYCGAMQGEFIDTSKKLIRSLEKRLDKAREEDDRECVHSLGL